MLDNQLDLQLCTFCELDYEPVNASVFVENQEQVPIRHHDLTPADHAFVLEFREQVTDGVLQVGIIRKNPQEVIETKLPQGFDLVFENYQVLDNTSFVRYVL